MAKRKVLNYRRLWKVSSSNMNKRTRGRHKSSKTLLPSLGTRNQKDIGTTIVEMINYHRIITASTTLSLLGSLPQQLLILRGPVRHPLTQKRLPGKNSEQRCLTKDLSNISPLLTSTKFVSNSARTQLDQRQIIWEWQNVTSR